MTSSQWYLARGGEQSGPVTMAELKRLADRGELGPEDLIWSEGWSEWQPARTVNGLVTRPSVSSPSASPAQPVNPKDAITSASPEVAGNRTDRQRIVDSLWYAGTIAFALLLVYGIWTRSGIREREIQGQQQFQNPGNRPPRR